MPENKLPQLDQGDCEKCKTASVCIKCKKRFCQKEGDHCRIQGYFATANGPVCVDCYGKEGKK